MSQYQEELRNIMLPILQRQDELLLELGELNIKRDELYIANAELKDHWMQICELTGIREEKLACLAQRRSLGFDIMRVNHLINMRRLELRQLRSQRKILAQPYHDKMHELVVKYPKGTLPLVSN